MWKSYFTFTKRHIKRNYTNYLINFWGLVVSIAAVILISLYVIQQFKHDTTQKKKNRIYRIELDNSWALASIIHGPMLHTNIPEIENYVRFVNYYDDIPLKAGDIIKKTDNLHFVDTSFFNIFTCKFILGNAKNAFKQKNAIILTDNMSKTLFGKENPIGKTITTINKEKKDTFIVSAIIENPKDFHLKIDAITNINRIIKRIPESSFRTFEGWNYPTYFLLKSSNINITKLENKIKNFIKEHPYNSKKQDRIVSLRPMNDIYFDYKGEYETGNVRHSNFNNLITLIGIAILILIISCINFINLNIAKSSLRHKEIGLRKVIGSSNLQIISMIAFEMFLTSILAVIFGVGIANLTLSLFSKIIGVELLFHLQKPILFILIGIIIFTTLFAGLPSGISLANKSINKLLSGENTKGNKGNKFRNILLSFQYFASAILMIASLLLVLQLNHLTNKKPGFKQEEIIVLKSDKNINDKFHVFQNEISKINGIKSLTTCNELVGDVLWTNAFEKEDGTQFSYRGMIVTENFPEVFGLKILEGETFKKGDKNVCLISEKTKQALNLQVDELNQKKYLHQKCKGVIRNFYYNSLHNNLCIFDEDI
ncbi:MAG: ABC transporter permease, partial [Bacteroidales bacterium]